MGEGTPFRPRSRSTRTARRGPAVELHTKSRPGKRVGWFSVSCSSLRVLLPGGEVIPELRPIHHRSLVTNDSPSGGELDIPIAIRIVDRLLMQFDASFFGAHAGPATNTTITHNTTSDHRHRVALAVRQARHRASRYGVSVEGNPQIELSGHAEYLASQHAPATPHIIVHGLSPCILGSRPRRHSPTCRST